MTKFPSVDEFVKKINEGNLTGIYLQEIDSNLLSRLDPNLKIGIFNYPGSDPNHLITMGKCGDRHFLRIYTISNFKNPSLYKDLRITFIQTHYLDYIEYNPGVKVIEIVSPDTKHYDVPNIVKTMDLLPNAEVVVVVQYRTDVIEDDSFVFDELTDLIILAPRDFTLKNRERRHVIPYFTRVQLAQFAAIMYNLDYPDITKEIVHLLTKNG